MQSMPASTCFLTVSAIAGVTLAAITTGSVISAPASRAGMSAQPLGGGKRPTCEVLIRVRLRRMFPSSLVSAFNPEHDHTTAFAIEPVAALTPPAMALLPTGAGL